MTTMKYAASGEQRKQLVNALSEVIGCESKYLKAPSYGYEVGYKSNYNDVPVYAEVSEITARFVQNWFAETVVRFMAIRSSTPRKNIVRMSGIATDAIKVAITVLRQFLPRAI